MWLIFHSQSDAPSGCDVRGQGGGGIMCLINDMSCSYRFNNLPGITRLLQYPLKKSNDLLELGIISDGFHFEVISVFVCPYK